MPAVALAPSCVRKAKKEEESIVSPLAVELCASKVRSLIVIAIHRNRNAFCVMR